jgi:O-acetyl-ADP-ribose deacetylase (regulator of RNase III)
MKKDELEKNENIQKNFVLVDQVEVWDVYVPTEKNEKSEDSDDKERAKFGIDPLLNSKISLWYGNIVDLVVDAIVNSTDENMTNTIGTSGIILERGGEELLDEIKKCEICRTGEVRMTKGHNLPSKNIIHTVGPRYHEKYRTAAENALHSCYRNSLVLLKENKLRTIAFTVVHNERKGYPPEIGAHIAIRIVL